MVFFITICAYTNQQMASITSTSEENQPPKFVIDDRYMIHLSYHILYPDAANLKDEAMDRFILDNSMGDTEIYNLPALRRIFEGFEGSMAVMAAFISKGNCNLHNCTDADWEALDKTGRWAYRPSFDPTVIVVRPEFDILGFLRNGPGV